MEITKHKIILQVRDLINVRERKMGKIVNKFYVNSNRKMKEVDFDNK